MSRVSRWYAGSHPLMLPGCCTGIAGGTQDLDQFWATFEKDHTVQGQLDVFSTNDKLDGQGDTEKRQAFAEAMAELREAEDLYKGDRASLEQDIRGFRDLMCYNPPTTSDQQHTIRKAFDPIAEKIKGLIKQVDLLYKLASRLVDLGNDLATDETVLIFYDRRGATRLIKDLDAARKDAVEQLKQAAYFHRQVAWLQDRFPEAKLADVPGLVKLVDRKDIAAADWCLTPDRYVGVAPPEEDEDCDFEEALRDIHVELASLNEEAAELARKIQANFEELGV